MQKQFQQNLERVLNYLEQDEKKHYLSAGKPAGHIYDDIHALRGWLNKSVAMSAGENVVVDSDRIEVAVYASYAVGSCFGDGDPKVKYEYEKVLGDEGVYQIWRERMLDHQKRTGGNGYAYAGPCNGAPVGENEREAGRPHGRR